METVAWISQYSIASASAAGSVSSRYPSSMDRIAVTLRSSPWGAASITPELTIEPSSIPSVDETMMLLELLSIIVNGEDSSS